MSFNTKFYDNLETRPPEEREKALFAALPYFIAEAQTKSSYFGQILEGVNGIEINSREALTSLPVTRKSALLTLQKENLPFGGLSTCEPGKVKRIYQSP